MRHSEFLAEHLGEWPGPIVDQDTGAVLGYHRGFWFHTIGQRKGVRFVRPAPAQRWRGLRALFAAAPATLVPMNLLDISTVRHGKAQSCSRQRVHVVAADTAARRAVVLC